MAGGTYDLVGDVQVVAACLVVYFVLDNIFKAVGWFPQVDNAAPVCCTS